MTDTICELCESRSATRIVDIGERSLHVCDPCTDELRRDAGALLEAAEVLYEDEVEA